MFERDDFKLWKDQEKQFENEQESAEDTIDNNTISDASSKKSDISVATGRKPYH